MLFNVPLGVSETKQWRPGFSEVRATKMPKRPRGGPELSAFASQLRTYIHSGRRTQNTHTHVLIKYLNYIVLVVL